MIIEDLLRWDGRWSLAAMPEADALTDCDALLEAALIDVKMDATTSSVWLLLDCRGAVELEMGNTAVVAISGVTQFQWRTELRAQRSWRAVMGWRPERSGSGFSCTAELTSGSSIHVSGSAAEFYVGDIPGGDEPPPDFTVATDAEIRAGLASWTSEFRVVHASFV